MRKIMMMGSTRVEVSPKDEKELRQRASRHIIETADEFEDKIAWRARPQSMNVEPEKSYRKARYS